MRVLTPLTRGAALQPHHRASMPVDFNPFPAGAEAASPCAKSRPLHAQGQTLVFALRA
jgi:hypothetical protein